MASNDDRHLRAYPRSIVFPETLSIAQAQKEIIQAWNTHQVLLIQSETGSGKSTQIPKMALAFLPHPKGKSIAITQPRRLATQVLASRLNQELGAAPGEAVGFHVRHQNCFLPKHFIKVMTEGILVQEASIDPLLSRYSTIILDEVHERSIHMDLLCGILKPILLRRPDLKIALLSATLEKEVFLSFFPKAHSLDFPGRSFKVEDYYWEGLSETPMIDRILWALDLLEPYDNGDVLVFCATEAEIHFFKLLLEKSRLFWEYHVLYSRLDPLKQSSVIKGSGVRRRVILSTNIAETSLTIPGLSAVIDLGTHKILQYNPQLRVTSYPIVPITQASIAQRRGRAGRTRPGTCFHLYTQEDALSRPIDRTPEIQRSSLAHVLLKILSVGQKIQSFSFVTEPHSSQMKEALQTLDLLELIDEQQDLTDLGRRVSHDPVDPRFSVILREAKKLHVGEEGAVIIGFLSTNDPRLRPLERKKEAQKSHSQDIDYSSEFLTILNFYKRLSRDTLGLSRRKFQQYCEKNFLQPLLVEQWREVIEELCQLMNIERSNRWKEQEFHSLQIHRSLVAGFVDKAFLLQEDGTYRGARGVVAKSPLGEVGRIKKSQWLLSITIESYLNTNRLRWVGPIAPMDLLYYGAKKSTIQLSQWTFCDQRRSAYVTESILLWGLPISGPRRRWAQSGGEKARTVAITGLVLQEYSNHFRSIRSWHEPFFEASQIAHRTQSSHLLRSPSEMVTLALACWPLQIWDGITLDQYQSLIPQAHFDSFFMGPVPCALSDLPDRISIDHNIVEIRYTSVEEIHHVELSLSEKLWNRYPGASWLNLIPYYRKQVVLDILARLPRSIKLSGESIEKVADFFLSEYTWPRDLFEDLQKFLGQYYEVPQQLCRWKYSSVPKRLIPTIWVESDNGDLHWMGPLDFKEPGLEGKHRVCLSSIKDRDKEMYESALSGLYRYIPEDHPEEQIYSKTDFFSWKRMILEDYAKYLRNACRIPDPHFLKTSDQILFLQIVLGSLLLPGEDFLLRSESERPLLKKRYEKYCKTEQKNLDKIRTLLHSRAHIRPCSHPWAQGPTQALQSAHFFCHISFSSLERSPYWIEATSKLESRIIDKPSLWQSFENQWAEFLFLSKIESRCTLSLSNPIWALWFEWMMSLLFQPYRPIESLSLKKAVLLCKNSSDFKKAWQP